MYTKPLAGRLDGVDRKPTKALRGTSPTGAVNFSSFLPQGDFQASTLQNLGEGKNMGKGVLPLEQTATRNNLGSKQMQALSALTAANAIASGADQQQGASFAQDKNLGLPLNPRDIYKLLARSAPDEEAAKTAVRVSSHRKATSPRARVEQALAQKLSHTLEDLRQKNDNDADASIGKLAAQFESGSKGIAAIGYDRHGGTSYGKYQLSSRAGTMKKFIEYCKTEAPDIAEQLEKSGGSLNPGGRQGKMPSAWIVIAQKQPERFEALQDNFIRTSHFEPAMRAIAEKTGINRDEMPFALQEVVFSTAVQHGVEGAGRIISRAMGQVGQERLDPDITDPKALAAAHETLIRKIYDSRSGQFQSSTQTVQANVKIRLQQEMALAISMLRQENTA